MFEHISTYFAVFYCIRATIHFNIATKKANVATFGGRGYLLIEVRKISELQSYSKYFQTYITSLNSITEVKVMAEVQAVKDLDKVKLISHLLDCRYTKQMADVWNVGLNLALRIFDLLPIKFDDIHHHRLLIKESKIGKLANIQLNAKSVSGH